MNANKLIVNVVFLCLMIVGCSKQEPEMAKTGAKETSPQTSMPTTENASTESEENVSAATTPDKPDESSQSVDAEPAAEEAVPAQETSSEAAESTEHIVKGVITQWQPLVTFAQPGDTIRFTNMTGHDTTSMEGMIPDGAGTWQSKLGEEGFTITVEKEGAYVYKCTPHITTGMVGIIVVGDKNPQNLEQLEQNVGNVKIGGNMVKRAIRKLKKQLEAS